MADVDARAIALTITGGLVAAVALGALFVLGGNPTTAPPPLPGGAPGAGVPADIDPTPRAIVGVVEATSPGTPAPVGSRCAFSVDVVPNPSLGYWCHADVSCNSQLLYGGQNAGYFPCRLEPRPSRDLVGSDSETSANDSDPAFEIDTRRGLMTLRDDARGARGAYELRARVLSIR